MDTDTSVKPVTDDGSTSPDTVIDLWFGAAVWCEATRVGTVCGFVCSTMSPHLHNVVVRDDERGHTEHPVALADIGDRNDRRDVTVRLPADEVRAHRWATERVIVDEPAQLRWVDLGYTAYDEWMMHPDPLHIPVTVPKLDPGETLVRTNAAVYVERHHVGRLSGLQVDPASRRITGCIIDVGHRWHHRHILLPAAAIEELSETTVRVHDDGREVTPFPHHTTTGT